MLFFVAAVFVVTVIEGDKDDMDEDDMDRLLCRSSGEPFDGAAPGKELMDDDGVPVEIVDPVVLVVVARDEDGILRLPLLSVAAAAAAFCSVCRVGKVDISVLVMLCWVRA